MSTSEGPLVRFFFFFCWYLSFFLSFFPLQSRPVRIKGMILKDWGLKYREAADKTNDKQFILFNDEGDWMLYPSCMSELVSCLTLLSDMSTRRWGGGG